MSDLDEMTRLPRRTPDPEAGPGTGARAGIVFLTGSRMDEEVWIEGDRLRIGREPRANDVVLEDANVSREHALVFRRDDRWFVSDRASTIGTWVDGRKISEAPLREGAVIQVAGVRLRFVFEGYARRWEEWAAHPILSADEIDVSAATGRAGGETSLRLGNSSFRLSSDAAHDLTEKLRAALGGSRPG